MSPDKAKKLKQLIRKARFQTDPASAAYEELTAIIDAIEQIQETLKTIKEREKGEKGADGKDGKTPKKGVDYFTEAEKKQLFAELHSLVKDVIPKDGKDGKDGRPGRMPIAGVDFQLPKDGRDGKDGKPGRSIIGPPGRDGSPDRGDEIVQKINALPKDAPQIDAHHIKGLPSADELVAWIKKNKSLEFRDIKNAPLNFGDMRWHGGAGKFTVLSDVPHSYTGSAGLYLRVNSSETGLEFVGASSIITWHTETPTGPINDTNVTFTLSTTPNSNSLSLYLNGSYQTAGVDYTLVGTTITFTYAPLTASVLTAKFTT